MLSKSLKKTNVVLVLIVAVFLSCCKGNSLSDSVKFEMLTGKIEKPVAFEDSPYDSICVEYNIAWPVGDSESASFIKAWIIERITKIRKVNNAKLELNDILNSIAEGLASSEGAHYRTIEVKAEENTPFDSYLTIDLSDETLYWMARYTDIYDASLSIRLKDGLVFQSDKAIKDTEKMRSMIGQNLQRKYKNEDPNWQWYDNITSYTPYNIPMPNKPIRLTKEGIWVGYDMGEISSSAAGSFSCVVPYDEVMYVLSNDAKEFLTVLADNNEVKKDASKGKPELSESEAIELIKKANLHEAGSLSAEFKAACNKDKTFGQNPFLKYGDYPDCVLVTNPDIKIFKIMPDGGDGEVTVIFDFIDKDAPHMGWISKQDYNKSICAMDMVVENGKWVVDDFYQAWDATPDTFNKSDAGSAKAGFNYEG